MQISVKKKNMEGVVHEGWLVKSPPEKRLLKAKWRQRWFVLRHSGHLPGQYILEYFTDNSCRKLKGKIDLDHCDQVDVGSTCETKKTTYQYMFDIITPKRTYYLVAESEAEMNKWVDCICTVGGLKLYVDEGSEQHNIPDFLITHPLSMISKGLLSSTALLSAVVVNNNYMTPQEPAVTSTAVTPLNSNLVETKSSSNPYIPISECHTGKPIPNGNLPKLIRSSDSVPHPPEQIIHERSSSSDFYDIPRPINPSISDSPSKFGTVQRPSSSAEKAVVFNGFKTLPPRVNWSTHPSDVVVPRSNSLVKQEVVDDGTYDIVPSLHPSAKSDNLKRDVKDLAGEFEKSTMNSSQETLISTSGSSACSIFRAPPRPPKPSKLRDRHDYENFEPVHLANRSDESQPYDVPPPVKGVSLNTLPLNQSNNMAKKDNDVELSASTQVPLSSSAGNDGFVDDTYDFPKFRSEDNINATVPTPHGTGTTQRTRRHAYSNAPPGLFNSKELIFNYEYRPSLMTDYVNMDNKQDQPPTSGDSVNSASVGGTYANLPNNSPVMAGGGGAAVAPPVINRGLKPKKSVDKGSFSFLTLQPPPLYKMRANKCTIRSDRFTEPGGGSMKVGLNGTPPVPNRYRHHTEIPGNSEEDPVVGAESRLIPSLDEQSRMYFAGNSKKRDEIQYLDLDLDSEPSPSPKSPERVSATVYKKVDFVKTKVFNELRQNVEDFYGNAQ